MVDAELQLGQRARPQSPRLHVLLQRGHHRPVLLDDLDQVVPVDLGLFREIGPGEVPLGKQRVVDDAAAVGPERPDHEGMHVVRTGDQLHVGRQMARAGEVVGPVPEPRHLAEQAFAARHHRGRVVEHAGAAALEQLERVFVGPAALGADRLRVQRGRVVDVQQVLDEQLPVAVELDFDLDREAAILLPEEAELLLEMRDEIGKRWRVVVEGDEDPARPDSEPQRRQAASSGIERLGLLHERSAGQRAFEIVAPAVIGAAEMAGIALAPDHLDPAMGAAIGERPEHAVVVADDDGRFSHDAERHVVARVRQLLDTGDAEPVLHEDVLLLQRLDFGREVERAGQMAGAADRPADPVEPLGAQPGDRRAGERSVFALGHRRVPAHGSCPEL